MCAVCTDDWCRSQTNNYRMLSSFQKRSQFVQVLNLRSVEGLGRLDQIVHLIVEQVDPPHSSKLSGFHF